MELCRIEDRWRLRAPDGTRCCWFKPYTKATGLGDWKPGYFHGWAQAHVEYESGPGNYPVGVVEDLEGNVSASSPEDVRFGDPTKETK